MGFRASTSAKLKILQILLGQALKWHHMNQRDQFDSFQIGKGPIEGERIPACEPHGSVTILQRRNQFFHGMSGSGLNGRRNGGVAACSGLRSEFPDPHTSFKTSYRHVSAHLDQRGKYI